MNATLLDDRSCVICHAPFHGGLEDRIVVHCCRVCGHPLEVHSDAMLRCSICANTCGIDCRPLAMRARDGWPVQFPWMAVA